MLMVVESSPGFIALMKFRMKYRYLAELRVYKYSSTSSALICPKYWWEGN